MENAENKLDGEIPIQGKEETFTLESLNPPDISPGWRPTGEKIKKWISLWIYLYCIECSTWGCAGNKHYIYILFCVEFVGHKIGRYKK